MAPGYHRRRTARDGRLFILTEDKVTIALPNRQTDAGHGSFDNDVAVVSQTLERVRGGQLLWPVDDLRGF